MSSYHIMISYFNLLGIELIQNMTPIAKYIILTDPKSNSSANSIRVNTDTNFLSTFEDKPKLGGCVMNNTGTRVFLSVADSTCLRNMFAAVPLLDRRVHSSMTTRDTTYRQTYGTTRPGDDVDVLVDSKVVTVWDHSPTAEL